MRDIPFVGLTLTDYTGNEKHSLDEIVDSSCVSIILGAPGSGKSRILREFDERQAKESRYLSVEDFLLRDETDLSAKFLLLDGFDEYRNSNTGKSKSTIVKELALKLSDFSQRQIAVVIACREMDWCGSRDEDALCNFVSAPVKVYTVEPLNRAQKWLFKQNLGMTDSDFALYDECGFLETPQMFLMSLKLPGDNLPEKVGKKYLYEKFIEGCRESNDFNVDNNVNCIELDSFKNSAAYIAFYYIFSDEFELNVSSLTQIANKKEGMPIENLSAVLKSSLIQKNRFCHRTIAEYLAAAAIAGRYIRGLSLDRIVRLVSSDGIVYSEYRGVYSWLCTLLEDKELIKIDPYLQYQYGDNSFFSISQKKQVVEAIRDYSQNDPYFYRRGFSLASKSFYEFGLDSFLIAEYRKCMNDPNHYLFFLSDLLMLGSSDEIRTLAKDVLEDEKLDYFYKVPFINVLKDDCVYLKYLLDRISCGEIKDEENDIRENLLNVLYPEIVSENEIINYLRKYNKEESFRSRGEYLLKTPNDKCYVLVKRLLLEDWVDKKSYLGFPDFIERFVIFAIENYLLEAPVENFWGNLEFLTQGDYAILHYIDSIWSHKKDLLISKERSAAILEKFIDYLRDKNIWLYADHYSFILEELDIPANIFVLIILKITKLWNLPKKCELYRNVSRIYSRKNRDSLSLVVKDLEKKLGVEKEITQEDEIAQKHAELLEKRRRAQKKEKNEVQKQIEKNEQWLRGFPEDSWGTKKNLLENIAVRVLFVEDLDKLDETSIGFRNETTRKILSIIKNLLFVAPQTRIEPESLTIETLVSSLGQLNVIDDLYYVCLTLNETSDFEKINDAEFRKYLYLVACHNFCTVNIRKTDYDEWFEKSYPKEALTALSIFIQGVFEIHQIDSKMIDEFSRLLQSEDPIKFIQKAKHIIAFVRPEKFYNTFFEYYIKSFHVKLSLDTLAIIKQLCTDDKVKKYCNALSYFKSADESHPDKGIVESLFDVLPGVFGSIDLRDLSFEDKVRLMKILFAEFDSDDKIKMRSGFQSKRDECVSFLRSSLWSQLHGSEGLDILKILLDGIPQKSIWKNRIKNRMAEIVEEQKSVPSKKILADLKDFILGEGFASYDDFYAFCIEKLNQLKTEIKDSRLNERDVFYAGNEPRLENECRDEILRNLLRANKDDLDIIQEGFEGHNRVDMRITNRKGKKYIVQVECKRDINTESLYKGLAEQLIDKYFTSGIYLGVYLVFCFKKDPDELQKDLEKNIPYGYEKKVAVICIDLRKNVY